MPELLDVLAQRVDSAVTLIQKLRDRVGGLERELEEANTAPHARAGSQAEELSSLQGEIERLRRERREVRERVQALIKEFDKVSS